MKLKQLMAASISAFAACSLLSLQVYADTTVTKKNSKKTTQQQTDAKPDYKGELAPIAVPVTDTFQIIYDEMSQNIGRVTVSSPDWFNRIGVGGGMNVDGHWGNRSFGYMGENYQRVSLNDAYLNVNALVNDWTKAFISLSYNNATPNNGIRGGEYDSASRPFRLNLNQGYITFSNFNVFPVFVQVGKQYSDYGRYALFPITRSFTQVMTESLQTSAKLGFIAPVFNNVGFNGQVYAFDNSLEQVGLSHTKTVWGASLGLSHPNDQFGYDLGIGYMSNILGVNDITYAVSTFQGVSTYSGEYTHLVGGIAVYGDLNTGPFTFSARYTTALQQFAPTDLSNYLGSTGANGSKPWAADVTAGLGFNGWGKRQNVYLGYQASGNAVSVLLPQSRWLVGYGINPWRNTILGLEVAHDKDYSSGHGATGRSDNIIGARAGVTFG